MSTNDWGAAVPPDISNSGEWVSNTEDTVLPQQDTPSSEETQTPDPVIDSTSDAPVKEDVPDPSETVFPSPEFDPSKYPNTFVYSEEVYSDGIPRVLMWTGNTNGNVKTANVHPDEAVSMSQCGWNFGNPPQ